MIVSYNHGWNEMTFLYWHNQAKDMTEYQQAILEYKTPRMPQNLSNKVLLLHLVTWIMKVIITDVILPMIIFEISTYDYNQTLNSLGTGYPSNTKNKK